MLEKEIGVNSGNERLAGTICLPSEKGRFPCVLMIHGSGPTDRDENARQLKFLKVKINAFNTIAHYLAPKGIASLRYDKRGCGKSSGKYWETGFYDLIQDAKAMYTYLTAQECIDKDLVFLLGHSEGTMSAPRISLDYPSIAGLILLAPNVQKMEEVLRWQAQTVWEEIQQLGGITGFLTRLQVKLIRYDPVKTQEGLFRRIKSSNKAWFRHQLVAKINAKWFREILEYDPADTIQNVTCPILAIGGEKDLQVHPEDVTRIAELAKGEVERHIVPNLTHVLRLDEGKPSILKYKKLLKKGMDHSILDIMYDWLQKRL